MPAVDILRRLCQNDTMGKKKPKLAMSMRDRTQILSTAIQEITDGRPLSPLSAAAVLEVLEFQLASSESALKRATGLSDKIAGLRFGTDALKEVLSIQCDRLATVVGEEAQDKIIDTLLMALKSKAPDPPPPAPRSGDASIGDYTPKAGGKYSDVEV